MRKEEEEAGTGEHDAVHDGGEAEVDDAVEEEGPPRRAREPRRHLHSSRRLQLGRRGEEGNGTRRLRLVRKQLQASVAQTKIRSPPRCSKNSRPIPSPSPGSA